MEGPTRLEAVEIKVSLRETCRLAEEVISLKSDKNYSCSFS